MEHIIKSIAAYAFRLGCSYIGAKPKTDVLQSYLCELCFFFKDKQDSLYTVFLSFLKQNAVPTAIKTGSTTYKGINYNLVYLSLQMTTTRKRLWNFKNFISNYNFFISW